jgi:four helix bundle protein
LPVSFKFEQLDVWKRALDYIDLIYHIADQLPRSEEYNLKSQIVRAATSVALNIAEGSTGQTDAEQARFLGMALRSLVETVACQHLIARRALLTDNATLRQAYKEADVLAAMLQGFRKKLAPNEPWVREDSEQYSTPSDSPF